MHHTAVDVWSWEWWVGDLVSEFLLPWWKEKTMNPSGRAEGSEGTEHTSYRVPMHTVSVERAGESDMYLCGGGPPLQDFEAGCLDDR